MPLRNNTANGGSSLASGSPALTPETDAVDINQKARSWEASYWDMREHARKLERERDEAITALMEIEEIYIDGCDTYEAWKAMGAIARAFLPAND